MKRLVYERNMEKGDRLRVTNEDNGRKYTRGLQTVALRVKEHGKG